MIPFIEKPSWLSHIPFTKKQEELQRLRAEHRQKLMAEYLAPYRNILDKAPRDCFESSVNDDFEVILRPKLSLEADERDALFAALKAFIPWKKGPFHIGDTTIDSEWQSQLKWKRLAPHLPSLKNKVVADIGCHNGFFMYHMLAGGASEVVGIEPVAKHWYNFALLNKIAPDPEGRLSFEMFGVEHMDLMPDTFDVIFCMGILYHHTDPVGLLHKMKQSLRKGGTIVIDCQGIAGNEPVALTPSGRYAGGTGFWFLPTLPCLKNWVKRAGLRWHDVFSGPLDLAEQRSTEWAPIKSLKDFLTLDGEQTIEGYPRPHRFYGLITKS